MRTLFILLGFCIAATKATYFLTYPSVQDCRDRLHTVQKVVTSSLLPAADQCDGFQGQCTDGIPECTVQANCLYEAVPSISSKFAKEEIYEQPNCNGTAQQYVYTRLNTCVEGKIISCTQNTPTVTQYEHENCTGTTSTTQENQCAKLTCPSDDPHENEQKEKEEKSTNSTTVAIAVVAAFALVLLIAVLIYYNCRSPRAAGFNRV